MLTDIPVFLTYVRSEYLYALKDGFGYFSPATVFALSSNQNEKLSFELMVDDKTHFSRVSVCALANSKTAPKINEDDCVYDVSPSSDITVAQLEYLVGIEHCGVWKRDSNFWQKGTYIFTVEWVNSKSQLHLIELDDGNYVFWPSERLTWGADVPDRLPAYGEE